MSDPLPGFKSNPKLYRELMVPFASMEEANKHIAGFDAEFQALRAKYRMRDVVVCIQIGYVGKDEEELDAALHLTFGDAIKVEAMLAHTLGMVQAQRQEMIASMLAKGVQAGLKRS